jgi:hypothetical protein
MATTTDVQQARGEDLFAKFNTKWAEWYKEAHSHDDPAKPLVKPPLEPTVGGLEKEIWVKASLLADGIKFDRSSLEASPDVIMRRIAPKRGQDCIVLNFAPFCMYWSNGNGCRFCNIASGTVP